MSHEQTGGAWFAGFSGGQPDPERLSALARWCEQLAPTEQRKGFERVLLEIASPQTEDEGGRLNAAFDWIGVLADSGAFESAAVALIPRDAIFTGGRLKDGSFVAQVILDGGVGAHSREAQSLAMAWIAALLRAFARQGLETGALTAH